jgi:thymidylate synthase ThyX
MTLSLQETDRALIAPYVTSTDGSVYALRHLPEEVVAVLFAYYSRSRESLRDNLLRLIREGDLALAAGGPDAVPAADDFIARAAEKARAFHEKWVVGYGHSSVAEHAVVHLAIEDVSILASKAIEDARLASYTEKSTRYVPFDTTRHHVPESFRNDAAPGRAWRRVTGGLARAYDESMPVLVDWFMANRAPKPGQTEKGHQAACRAQACDVLRYLLPAATHTNLGLTANARVLESLLARLLSHPLAEVRDIGRRMKAEALLVVPTLIKYAEPSDYRRETHAAMRERVRELLGPDAPAAGVRDAGHPAEGGVRLIRWDEDAEERIVEAILAGASDRGGEEIRATVRGMTPAARAALIDDYLARRGRHDPPLRALEATGMTFEIVVDYGAWRDLQRHRMLSIEEQPLTPALGYERPEALAEAGLAGTYDGAMAEVIGSFPILAAESPEEAAYAVPLAFRKRAFLTLNLRELHHLVPLRSARQGHTSYRRVAQAMHAAFARVHPALARSIRVDLSDYDLSRA